MEYYQNLGCCHHENRCLCAWYLLCRQKWGSNFAQKPNLINPKSKHCQTYAQKPNLSGKLEKLHLIFPIICWKISLPHFTHLSNSHIALQHKTWHTQILHEKCLHITYDAIFSYRLFRFCYQHQIIELVRIQTVTILLHNLFSWVNKLWYIASNNLLTKTKCIWYGVNFVVLTVQ